MIRNLVLDGFRGFRRFEVRKLGRINLLVGTNNCGKTSILEAVQLFGSNGDPSSLWDVASRRGERLDIPDPRRVSSQEADVCHLFHGHEFDIGSKIQVVGQTDDGAHTFSAEVVGDSDQMRLFDEPSMSGTGELEEVPDWALNLEWSAPPNRTIELPLTVRGGLRIVPLRRYARTRLNGGDHVRFISTAGMSVDDVVATFEAIVLTREEELVIQALRAIEPTIDRIATVGTDGRRISPGERGGIVVKYKDSSQRLPIGSMGDGMWRMLGLALAIASAENGILLVDEIDTGLHFTVMERMWKLVNEASSRLGVQVFATTHSRDAYESLAAISSTDASDGSEVTIQRIDRSKAQSVAFTEQEIVASAERGTEVR